MEGNSPESKTDNTGKLLLGLIIGIVVTIWFLMAVVYPRLDRPRYVSRPAPSNPYATFQTVRNDCGMCGTNSPVGAWEAEDGRWIVFRDNGRFTLSDDGTISGTWRQTSSTMCFAMTERSDPICHDYQQKTDAMKLGDVIYIRE